MLGRGLHDLAGTGLVTEFGAAPVLLGASFAGRLDGPVCWIVERGLSRRGFETMMAMLGSMPALAHRTFVQVDPLLFTCSMPVCTPPHQGGLRVHFFDVLGRAD